MTYEEIAASLSAAVDKSKKMLTTVAAAEKAAEAAKNKADQAQEAYRMSLAEVKDIKAQFDATLADHLKG